MSNNVKKYRQMPKIIERSPLAVCVLIVNKNTCQFLSVTLKHDHTDFNLPGGTVEKGESFKEAGIREVKEETGLDVYNLKNLHTGYDGDIEVITLYTHDYEGKIYTTENHIVKWLPLYSLNHSKQWPKYNSEVYNQYLSL